MSKCSCYHTKEVRNYTFHPLTRAPIPHDETVGVCYGTKEMDECSCGGDAAKCDFYPEKRKKAQCVADMVEVVRCKDCKYWGGATYGYICNAWSGINTKNYTKPTEYCARGERKEQK